MTSASRDFRLLVLGQTTSQLGAQVSGVAIPLLAVLVLRASPLQLGIVNASGTLAFAVLGLPVGAWTDRWRRRRTLIASDVARAVLLATIPLAAWIDVLNIGQLVVVALLVGTARVFFDVGYQSYLPTVLGADRVLAGNATMETIRASGQVAGPGLGGWLVSVLGAAAVVLVQSITFAVSALSLLAIRTHEPAVARSGDRTRLRHEIADGLRFVLRNPILRATALTSAIANFAFAIGSSVMMIFLVRTLRMPAPVVGAVLASGALAALGSAAATPWLARRFGSARVIWLPLAATGPLGVLTVLARPGWSAVLVVLGTAAGEVGQLVYAISNVSLRQRLCPSRLLGRVNATMGFLIMGLFPLGALVGGALGDTLGPRRTLLLLAAVLIVAPLPSYRALRHVREVTELPAWTTPASPLVQSDSGPSDD